MVEWNGIFRLFRFSGILGQPREVAQNFGMKFRKMSVPFAPKAGISGIFGRMESAPCMKFTKLLSAWLQVEFLAPIKNLQPLTLGSILNMPHVHVISFSMGSISRFNLQRSDCKISQANLRNFSRGVQSAFTQGKIFLIPSVSHIHVSTERKNFLTIVWD